MLTSKQRAHLKSLASTEQAIVMVGKSGVTGQVIDSAQKALQARELVKGKVLESSPLSPDEVADALAMECAAEVVQVIGSKFVLFRRNPKKPKISLAGAHA